MSLPTPSEHTASLWENVIRHGAAANDNLRAFLVSPSFERITSVRQALNKPSERAAALNVLPHLSIQERTELFPELVRLASCAHGHIQLVRDAIVSLPRDWVVAHIESVADPLLANSSELYQFEEYRRLLELYDQLGDPGLVRRLAQRASEHGDEDVREAGQEFLARWL